MCMGAGTCAYGVISLFTLLSIFVCFVLKTRFLAEPRAHSLSRLTGQQAPGPSSASSLELQTHTATMFHCLDGCWRSELRSSYLKEKHAPHWAISSVCIYFWVKHTLQTIKFTLLWCGIQWFLHYIHEVVLWLLLGSNSRTITSLLNKIFYLFAAIFPLTSTLSLI